MLETRHVGLLCIPLCSCNACVTHSVLRVFYYQLIDILKGLSGRMVGEGKEGSSQNEAPESSLLLELQSDILITLSCLCETDIHRKVCVCREEIPQHSYVISVNTFLCTWFRFN